MAQIRGVVQIAHGMGEHIGRYGGTIDALVSAGFTVFGHDHRGHGRTASSPEQLGDWGEGGFDLLVQDLYAVSRAVWDEYADEPFFLLGHSMGSFAAQQYVLDHSRQIDGLVLSGSGALDGLADLARSAPEGVNILNAPFEPARTPFDWLSRDSAVVDAFINDPLCFPQLRPASLDSFLAAAPRLCDPDQLIAIRHDLPVLVFSGGEDPIGQRLEGVRLLIERYRRSGMWRISQYFYPGARHEMLNETCSADVRATLLRWMSRVLQDHENATEAGAIAASQEQGIHA
jgi:alpha-beta hydrolase superfamily lysophospholipase